MRQVCGWGNPAARYVLIGEAPGEREEETGEPFVGASGWRLKEWWEKAGLCRQDFYIDNVCQYRPPHNNIEAFERGYLEQWMSHLQERLSVLTDPWVLIPTGNYALYALTGKGKVKWHATDGKQPRAGILDWRGSILSYTDLHGRLIKVVPTIHPAATFRQADLEGVCIRDWQKIAKEGTFKELNLPKRNHVIRPTLEQVESYLGSFTTDDVVAVDIENPRPKEASNEAIPAPIVCLAFASRPDTSFTIPLTQNYWGSQAVVERVWSVVGAALRRPDVEWVFHNGLYDTFHLAWERALHVGNYRFDTLYLHHALDPSDWHSLDYCASRDTRQPFWKHEAKDPEEAAKYANNLEAFWTYNGIDACVTRELYDVYTTRLKEQGRLDFYLHHYADLLEPLQALQLHGIRVDEPTRKKRLTHLMADCIELQDQLQAATGTKLHGKSSLSNDKIKQYLYETLGLPKQERTRKARGEKSTTADELAVRKLLLKYPKVLGVTGPMMLDHKRKAKLREFYDEGRVDSDGRMRASYSMNTEAGRLSSSSNPNGSGSNLQNQSRDIRDMFLADEGMVGIEVDLSAAEARINYIMTYMLTGRKDLFEKAHVRPDEYDQHTENASFIFNVPSEQVTKDQRHLGKATVHGCVDGQTEVLTLGGFKPIAKLTKWDSVAQWDMSTGTISFVIPTHIHQYQYEGAMYRYRSSTFSQYLTPNHRMPYWTNAKYKVQEAAHSCHGADAPVSGHYEGPEHVNHDLIRLIVALQADGSIANSQLSWHLKKPRKIERLISLLNRLGWSYTRINSSNQTVHIRVSQVVGREALYWLPNKVFTERLLQFDGLGLDALINELPYWDGGHDEGLQCYRSAIEDNAKWVQTICHLRGYRTYLRLKLPTKDSFSDKPHWRIAWQKGVHVGLPKLHKTSNWKGPVYCVTVPTSFFVVRRNGEVSITGNSWRDMQGRKLADSLLKEGYVFAPNECQGFIDAYKQRMEGIDAYFRWCRRQAIEFRYVENSWGRRLHFTYDRFGDELYRRVYSFYPQAEVADWMNQLGLKPFFWYIQDCNRREGGLVAAINVHAHDALFFSVLPKYAYPLTKFLVDSLEQSRSLYGTTLAIPTEIKCGTSWKGTHAWKRLPSQAVFEEAVHDLHP